VGICQAEITDSGQNLTTASTAPKKETSGDFSHHFIVPDYVVRFRTTVRLRSPSFRTIIVTPPTCADQCFGRVAMMTSTESENCRDCGRRRLRVREVGRGLFDVLAYGSFHDDEDVLAAGNDRLQNLGDLVLVDSAKCVDGQCA